MNSLRLFFFVAIIFLVLNFSLAQKQHELALGAALHTIQPILDSISASNIHAYLDTLVGFFTRHTVSDTTSDSIGIGAARRWVFKKFQEFSIASGGRLQPMYFDFDATICSAFKTYKNVMAILPGTLTPDRYFIVSGHLDNRGHPTNACLYENIFAPGANDDGSGTAISIELARVMSQYQFDASIIFMTVVGEDEGLYGSAAYATSARQNNMRIDGMITNDVVGNIVGSNGIVDSMSVRHFSSVNDATPHRQFARYMRVRAEQYYPSFTVNLIPEQDRPGRGGDHQPFQDEGYTAVRFTEPNENTNLQHNANDIVANMSPAYTARVARVNAAGLASVASAPETPTGLQLFDPGNGTQLLAQWPSVNTEPDFAGYRVAVRDSGALYYSSITDVGNVQQATISGLTPNVAVYVGISGYDTAGNESIFSQEVLSTPSPVPYAPSRMNSTSFASSIVLSWSASPQLDVIKYRIYRSLSRSAGFFLYDSVNAPTTQYTDVGISSHTLYFYYVTAVDNEGNESSRSKTVPGQLATHDAGILVVDETKDSPAGSPLFPTDEAVDSLYDALLCDAVASKTFWDVADSLGDGISITDADMATFSTVVWHSDVRNGTPIYNDSTEMREYLQQGGQLLLSGWKLSSSFKLGGGSGTTVFPPNSFVPLYLKVDSTQTTGLLQQDFYTANSSITGYPSLKVDSAKLPFFNGSLVNTDVFLSPLHGASTEVLYTYHAKNPGSMFEGKPVGLRYLGSDYKLIFFSFPLYYMELSSAKNAINNALIDFGFIVDPAVCPLTISDTVRQRWNLVSLPVRRDDRLKNNVFPFSVSSAFAYEGSYVVNDTLEKGIGYWLKFDTSRVVQITGLRILRDTIDVVNGWNLIGSITYPVSTSDIASIPPGLVVTNFFAYVGGYRSTDTIQPGKGYWVKSSQDGKLILSSSTAISLLNRIQTVPTSELPPPPPEGEISNLEPKTPSHFALAQNYPNPFNPLTVIRYQLPVESEVTLKIYNVLGQEVKRLVDEIQDAGDKSVEWNSTNNAGHAVASGIYFYRLQATSSANPSQSFTQIRQMLLLK